MYSSLCSSSMYSYIVVVLCTPYVSYYVLVFTLLVPRIVNTIVYIVRSLTYSLHSYCSLALFTLSHLSLLLAKARIGDIVTCVDLKVLNVPDMNGPLGPGLIKKYPAVAGYS
jgi:hypothetical protein